MKALVGWNILFKVPKLINLIVFFTRIKNDMNKEDKIAWDLIDLHGTRNNLYGTYLTYMGLKLTYIGLKQTYMRSKLKVFPKEVLIGEK